MEAITQQGPIELVGVARTTAERLASAREITLSEAVNEIIYEYGKRTEGEVAARVPVSDESYRCGIQTYPETLETPAEHCDEVVDEDGEGCARHSPPERDWDAERKDRAVDARWGS